MNRHDKTIDFLNKYTFAINYAIDANDILNISSGLDLNHIDSLSEGILNNCIIKGDLDLATFSSIPNNCLNNCIIEGYLDLKDLEYLPQGFSPNVKSFIYLKRLKSKLLKDLIFNPGVRRHLGINLLKSLY